MKPIKSSVIVTLTVFAVFLSAIKIISIGQNAEALNAGNGIVIMIDPGHGGGDPGAVSSNGTKESELNVKISFYLREYLLKDGFQVELSRGNGVTASLGADEGISNDERKKRISSCECDAVVSIHMNKFSDSSAHGSEVYYRKLSEEGKNLAQMIQNSMINELDKTNKRIIRGVDNLYVLKCSKSPSVLVECGYISNYEEEQKLLTVEYQRRVAFSIYCGILKYFNSLS